jgi:hypothetical protein
LQLKHQRHKLGVTPEKFDLFPDVRKSGVHQLKVFAVFNHFYLAQQQAEF